MRQNNFLNSVTTLALLLFFASCDSNRVFENNTSINNNNWRINQVVKFDVKITDITHRNNLYINIRNSGAYNFSNLYLFIKTNMPNGKTISDTLECILANEQGKWLGRGTGHILDNQIPFKKNILFPDTGTYHFEIEQAMRMETLPEIYDIGLRIEKAQ